MTGLAKTVTIYNNACKLCGSHFQCGAIKKQGCYSGMTSHRVYPGTKETDSRREFVHELFKFFIFLMCNIQFFSQSKYMGVLKLS